MGERDIKDRVERPIFEERDDLDTHLEDETLCIIISLFKYKLYNTTILGLQITTSTNK